MIKKIRKKLFLSLNQRLLNRQKKLERKLLAVDSDRASEDRELNSLPELGDIDSLNQKGAYEDFFKQLNYSSHNPNNPIKQLAKVLAEIKIEGNVTAHIILADRVYDTLVKSGAKFDCYDSPLSLYWLLRDCDQKTCYKYLDAINAIEHGKSDLNTALKSKLLIKAHKRSVAVLTLEENIFSRDSYNIDPLIQSLYLKCLNYFSDHESICKLFDLKIKQHLSGDLAIPPEILHSYLRSLGAQDRIDDAIELYETVTKPSASRSNRDLQPIFDIEYDSILVRGLRFEEVLADFDFFKYCQRVPWYRAHYLNFARSKFYTGNKFQAKVVIALILIFQLGTKGLQNTDLKILFGDYYQHFKNLYLKLGDRFTKSITKLQGSNYTDKVLNIELEKESQWKTALESGNVNHSQLRLHLTKLLNEHRYNETVILHKKLRELPGFPWLNPYLWRRVVGLNQNSVKEYFSTFLRSATFVAAQNNISNFKTDISSLSEKKILILAQYGPGDEIIASCTYTNLVEWAKNNGNTLTIATQQRMIKLLQPSFPEIKFIKCERVMRGILNEASRDTSIISSERVKSNLLSHILDKNTEDLLPSFDCVTTTPTLIENFFSPNSHRGILTPQYLVESWKSRLAQYADDEKTLFIGLAWRSSLRTLSRNVHYFDADELAPLSQIKNAVFISLQIQHTAQEINTIKKLGLRVIHFAELDLLDDFVGTASLIKCLDAVICPFVATGELSGAVGTKTFLLSPTKDTNWRVKTHSDHSDLIYKENRVKVVFPSDYDQKETCIRNVVDLINKGFKENYE